MPMKTRFLLVAMAVLAASCSVYHPQSVDIPLVDHRGELRADVAVSASTVIILPDAVNLNTTFTYAATDWLAGQLHANYGGDNYYVQAAPGVYKPIGKRFVLEGYFGAGYGGIDHAVELLPVDRAGAVRLHRQAHGAEAQRRKLEILKRMVHHGFAPFVIWFHHITALSLRQAKPPSGLRGSGRRGTISAERSGRSPHERRRI